ncbi:hypothetical protein [Pseudaminobacter sp. NGMCC 1.201702]|uniref:hypothetical protein n=1 Tax=Pseudaminobacter sp. NGMCC 1.201702 TaxID=3391825 RepID=UPI0039EEBD00
MVTSAAFMIFVAVSIAWLSMRALQDHRRALELRRSLLDSAARLFPDAQITVGRDSFPILVGHLPDRRRVKIELIADTLVFRRLPQLWLKMTVSEATALQRPSIGALARPTGAEFYSIVHDLPEWMPPPQTGAPLLMRGDGRASHVQAERVSALFQKLFSDPGVKEAVITPGGVRLIRQAAQGERGAHLVLRQISFPITAVSQELVRMALSETQALSQVLLDERPVPAHATI